MKYIFLLLAILTTGCSSLDQYRSPCEGYTSSLPPTPEDIGPRVKNDVQQKLSSSDLYKEFIGQVRQDCFVGEILIKLQIKPNGMVAKAEKVASTFVKHEFETALLTMVKSINYGNVNSKESSIVYLPFKFIMGSN